MRRSLVSLLPFFLALQVSAQATGGAVFPVQGFCIGAPRPDGVADFVTFIEKELVPRHVNTLILRVDYNYKFKSYPELRDSIALSKSDVRKLVSVCKSNGIRIIPQINFLGHQSWAGRLGTLLRVFPQFDETPHITMPEKYVWPNPDNLYCKSYCPLHPDLHKVLFGLMDELCDVFETDAFHAGMDEVFYIADPKCPRCAGLDPSVLFAGEVRTLRDHLASKGRELWIWGDRLIDGKTTGMGRWEASLNNTYRAVDMIPRDVVICDWHYARADKTAVYFAMKGLRVITCPWRRPEVAVQQVDDMANFIRSATPATKPMYLGVMQTVWSNPESFMTGFRDNAKDDKGGQDTPWFCFQALTDRLRELE